MTPLDSALSYAAAGWRVAWGLPGKKYPAITEWQNVATTDRTVIHHWYAEHPDANVCVATGPASNLWVLDVDDNPAKNKKGSRTLAALEREHGDLPLTYATGTGSGGVHYYWTWEGVDFDLKNSVGRLGLDLDTRGIGGQVMAPPSVSDTGPYVLLDARQPVAAPSWLIAMLRPAARREIPAAAPAPEPQASHPLFAQPAKFYVATEAGAAVHPYAAQALSDELDIIRSAPDGQGNDTINRSCFKIGTLVGAAWTGVTEDAAVAAVHAVLGNWTWRRGDDIRTALSTVARAIEQGSRTPRIEPVQPIAREFATATLPGL